MLVHGLGGGPYELQRLGEHLNATTGKAVRAIQLPGHEHKSPFMPHTTWPQWVAGLESHLEAFERDTGDTRIDVVAFSMGTLPTLRLARQRRVRGRLALLAPFINVYRPAGINIEWTLGLAPWVPRRLPPLQDKALLREVRACAPFKWFSVRSAQSALALARQVLAEARVVSQPTLVLQGDRDTVVNAASAERLAHNLSEGAEFHRIRGSDHLLTLDAQHREVFDLVTGFLGD